MGAVDGGDMKNRTHPTLSVQHRSLSRITCIVDRPHISTANIPPYTALGSCDYIKVQVDPLSHNLKLKVSQYPATHPVIISLSPNCVPVFAPALISTSILFGHGVERLSAPRYS